jgi:hypothetical protein
MFTLVWSMVLSLLLSTFMMMLSLNSRQRHWQALSTLFAFGLLLFAFFSITGMFTGIINSAIPFDTFEFWMWNVFLLIGCLSYAVLFQQITAAQLTHESGNRSTKIRFVASMQFLLVWVTIAAIIAFTPSGAGGAELFVTLFMVLFVHWGVVTLFVCTEHDYLSRRIRRDLPRRRLWRTLMIPFLPGGAFGLLYSAIHVSALLALVMFAATNYSYGTVIRVNPEAFVGLACYFVIFASVGTFLIRTGHSLSGEFRPAHARIITVLFVLFCIIAPLIPRVFSQYTRYSQYEVYDIINPVFTVNYLAGIGYYNAAIDRDTALYILVAAAVLGVLCNLPAFRRATKIVFHAEETLPEFLDPNTVFEMADDEPETSAPAHPAPQQI